MSIRKSIMAKLLIMLLCLSLVLCGCSSASNDQNDDSDSDSTSKTTSDSKSDDSDDDEDPIVDDDDDIVDDDDDENPGFVMDALECGKITISKDGFFENVLYIDSNDMRVADELSLEIDGVELALGLYANQNDLALELPGIIDGAYGINFETLMSDLEDSELWNLMGISYDEFMAEMEAALDQLSGMGEQSMPMIEDLTEAFEEALGYIDCDTEETIVTINGTEVDAIVTTYSVTTEDVENMANVMIEWLEEYADDIQEAIDSMADEDMEGMEDLAGSIDEIKDYMDEFFAEASIEGKLVINTNPYNDCIMTINGELLMDYEGEEAGIYLELNLGADPANSDEYSLSLDVSSDDVTMNVFQMVLERNITNSELSYELTAESMGVELFTAALEYDKESYEYLIYLDSEEFDFSLDGTYKVTEDTLEMSIGTIRADGERLDIDVEMKIEAISANDIPDVPRYTNILTLSEDELMDLLSEISAAFE